MHLSKSPWPCPTAVQHKVLTDFQLLRRNGNAATLKTPLLGVVIIIILLDSERGPTRGARKSIVDLRGQKLTTPSYSQNHSVSKTHLVSPLFEIRTSTA